MSRVSKLSIKNNINSLILSALEKLKHTDEYFSDAAQLEMYFYGADRNVQNGSALLQEITFNTLVKFRNFQSILNICLFCKYR